MNSPYILKICLFLLLYSVLYSDDTRLRLIHADLTSGKMIDGERIHLWSGHIEAIQDTLKINCDEAVFNEAKNRTEFTGNVLLNDGHHKLWADKIIYFTDTKTAHCYGGVRISGLKDSLYAEKFVYNFKDGNAKGETNLYIWDKENHARIYADSGLYISDQRQTFINGRARFEQNKENQADTLIITAKRMAYFGLNPKKAIAVDSVRIFKGNVRAVCDSAAYLIGEEMVQLRLEPVAWQQQNEMRGNTIDLKLDSLIINEIFIFESAHMKSIADTSEQRYNLLKGKSIQVSLLESKPQRIIARNNASSVYMLEDEGVEQGTNSASSDSIIIFFSGGEIDSIAIVGGTEGIFYPPNFKGEIKGAE